MLHTPQSTPLLLPLSPNKSRRCTNPVFFNPVLIFLLPVRSIQAGFLNHHKKRFHLVWSSLNYFPVQQPAATNSMHLQSTYTLHLQHIKLEGHMESCRTTAVEFYCGNSQRIKAVGYFRRRAPFWMFDRIVNVTLPNNYVSLHQKLATFPGMFGNITRNFRSHSPEYLATLPGMFGDILQNVWQHSSECLRTFPGMFGDIPRKITFPPFPAFPAFRSPFLYSWFYT